MDCIGDTRPITPRKTGPLHKSLPCPVCGGIQGFQFFGTQKWPAPVAQAMNISATVALWRCDVCKTTISTEH